MDLGKPIKVVVIPEVQPKPAEAPIAVTDWPIRKPVVVPQEG